MSLETCRHCGQVIYHPAIGGVNVIKGPVALAAGSGWIGVASGNRYAKRVRRKPETAIRDADKIERATPAPETRKAGET